MAGRAPVLLAWMCSPLAARAEPAPSEVVATGQNQPAAPSQTQPAQPIQTTTADNAADPDASGAPDDRPDRKVHGMVSVGVGTGGYRRAAGVVTAPVGDDGQVSVAIDAGQYGRR